MGRHIRATAQTTSRSLLQYPHSLSMLCSHALSHSPTSNAIARSAAVPFVAGVPLKFQLEDALPAEPLPYPSVGSCVAAVRGAAWGAFACDGLPDPNNPPRMGFTVVLPADQMQVPLTPDAGLHSTSSKAYIEVPGYSHAAGKPWTALPARSPRLPAQGERLNRSAYLVERR